MCKELRFYFKSFNFIVLMMSFSLYAQRTVYIDLELNNDEVEHTFLKPKIGEYRINAILNGINKVSLSPV